MKGILRPIRIEGDVAYVPLTKGYEAVIDAADVSLVAGINWSASVRGRTVYAYARHTSLHRLIMKAPPGLCVDHCDGDGLNNQRDNLRLVTHGQNMLNQKPTRGASSELKGVRLHKRTGQWRATITINRKTHHLGLFATEQEAHAAYVAASRYLHGEYGRTA